MKIDKFIYNPYMRAVLKIVVIFNLKIGRCDLFKIGIYLSHFVIIKSKVHVIFQVFTYHFITLQLKNRRKLGQV